MVSNRNKNILFTGLIRNEKLFEEKLKKSLQLRDKGYIKNIVFSTWHGEIEKYPNIEKIIKNNDIIQIKSNEPNIKTPGYIIHQMKSLKFGLDFFDDSDYVYKMRPDLGGFNIENIVNLINGNYNKKIKNELNHIFDERVVIDGGFLTNPFYINDIQFFGKKSDLLNLVNFDLKYDIIYNDLSPEQYFFAPVFIENFDIFKNYFKINQGLFHGNESLEKKYLTYFFNSDFHLLALSYYIYILNHLFYINGEQGTPKLTKQNDYNPSPIEEIKSLEPFISFYPSLNFSPAFKGMSWINFFYEYNGNCNSIKKIRANLESLEDNVDIFNIKKEQFNFEEIARELNNNFNNNRTKLTYNHSKNEYLTRGGFIRVTIPNSEDLTIRHLEKQLNETKRKYDDVCKELERLKNNEAT